MNDELQHRKEFLVRKNWGRLNKNDYERKIDNLFVCRPDNLIFVSLEDSDSILETERGSKHILEKYTSATFCLKDFLERVLESEPMNWYLYIDSDWYYGGAIYVSSLSLDNINPEFHFGDIITDDIILVSEDRKTKILIDYYEELPNQYFIDCDIFRT